MPETTAASETKVLYLEFDNAPHKRFASLADVADSLEAVNRVFLDLGILSMDSGTIIFAGTDVDIVWLEMRSPLKMVLGVAKLPKAVIRAFVHICERVLFLPEERDRRAAVAAATWEDVMSKCG